MDELLDSAFLENYIMTNTDKIDNIDEAFDFITKQKNKIKRIIFKFKSILKIVFYAAASEQPNMTDSVIKASIGVIFRLIHSMIKSKGKETAVKGIGYRIISGATISISTSLIAGVAINTVSNLSKAISNEKVVLNIINNLKKNEKDENNKKILDEIANMWKSICAKINNALTVKIKNGKNSKEGKKMNEEYIEDINSDILSEMLLDDDYETESIDEAFEAISKAKEKIKKLVTIVVSFFKKLFIIEMKSEEGKRLANEELKYRFVATLFASIYGILIFLIGRRMGDLTQEEFEKFAKSSKGIGMITTTAISLIGSLIALSKQNIYYKRIEARIITEEKSVSKIITQNASKEKDEKKKTVWEVVKNFWDKICAKANSIFSKVSSKKEKDAKQESFDLECENFLASIE